jgi:hypothetical protein
VLPRTLASTATELHHIDNYFLLTE